ncbi:hypothetical protein KORDIASMS9_03362 [Kordia sp. SMS9]|uniref:hypothetical protein n=1 Tax=Kordia sp. SMS9 TaxID=2282170 RepID=UPI000E104B52|nr:hypothetical protein [Kordia sp. SMS9]AXG71107.1 hypothetical protein KORDIASMS9_03362 [Kordia sp. SMS9]
MKTLLTLCITIAMSIFAQAQEKVNMSDFESLNNTNWKGELMYVNYSDNKEVTLPTMLQIEIKRYKIIFTTKYTTEESENNKSTLKVKKDGTYIGKQKVTKVNRLANGSLEIETMYEGLDDNRDATIYITYFFNDTTLTMKKEVEFKDAPGKFIRNRYSYIKS